MDDSPATAAVRTHPRGRTIALESAFVSVAVLAVAACVGRGWLVETWYLHQLGSTDEETRLAAAEKLGEMGSLRAVPTFMSLIRDNDREAVIRVVIKQPPPPPGFDALLLTPLFHALYEVGPGPSARKLVEKERQQLADAQRKNRPRRPWGALGCILAAWEHDEVQRVDDLDKVMKSHLQSAQERADRAKKARMIQQMGISVLEYLRLGALYEAGALPEGFWARVKEKLERNDDNLREYVHGTMRAVGHSEGR